MFTVFSYWYYIEDYGDNVCFSLWSCFIYSYDQTFKNGGISSGIESAFAAKESNSTFEIRYGRVLYDNLSFLFVGTLLIGIMSSLIIDTFQAMRKENDERSENFSTYCFICNKTRDDLEKEYGANGFDNHINQQHNLWDYLFFIAYLNSKNTTKDKTLSTAERYILEKHDKGDNTWLP
jgi:hypothetical protein